MNGAKRFGETRADPREVILQASYINNHTRLCCEPSSRDDHTRRQLSVSDTKSVVGAATFDWDAWYAGLFYDPTIERPRAKMPPNLHSWVHHNLRGRLCVTFLRPGTSRANPQQLGQPHHACDGRQPDHEQRFGYSPRVAWRGSLLEPIQTLHKESPTGSIASSDGKAPPRR